MHRQRVRSRERWLRISEKDHIWKASAVADFLGYNRLKDSMPSNIAPRILPEAEGRTAESLKVS